MVKACWGRVRAGVKISHEVSAVNNAILKRSRLCLDAKTRTVTRTTTRAKEKTGIVRNALKPENPVRWAESATSRVKPATTQTCRRLTLAEAGTEESRIIERDR